MNKRLYPMYWDTHKDMPIKSLDEIMKDTSDPLHEIVKKYDGLWSKEAEDYVLANQKEIQV
ncbi:hypothetical protein J32TS6_40490 [Virgibacillus pantothenticus]|uniref:hypothetical protein n=2 Tax=Virgibacillus TaxID=84406 RepID=UPI00090CC035|nr:MULTISPECIES: hypothetical protein [Virgibacillus]API91720.1 hypothetical protein BKP57_07695 [Virgibacillus sp. 6R]MBU8568639.1 hypothetical protein [Virgibacillus pantothenticus]MBU8602618.1 hypothetical protein [Virgibacillus pantothenticus]MBU8636739.1 hypothetical protein [Virgibacillus pantothenticus]MBU8666493.1 hypothetical protein [Virgibacillus pantothenticus]